MCVRSVHYCSGCDCAFVVPARESLAKRMVCCGGLVTLARGVGQREALTDWICNNKLCQRRTEEGYRVCLNVKDPCYFCIRYGHETLCYNRYVHFTCDECFAESSATLTSPATAKTVYPRTLPYYRIIKPFDELESNKNSGSGVFLAKNLGWFAEWASRPRSTAGEMVDAVRPDERISSQQDK